VPAGPSGAPPRLSCSAPIRVLKNTYGVKPYGAYLKKILIVLVYAGLQIYSNFVIIVYCFHETNVKSKIKTNIKN